MNSEAIKRINEEKEKKSGTLDLSICGLTVIPTAIREMDWLTDLYLGNNQITKIEQLDKLEKLTVLYLGNNQITKIEQLDKLSQLTGLSLSGNQITKIEQLDKLEKLEILDLSRNQITKIEQLDKLEKLEILDLYKNQITKIEQLEKLSQLTGLNLSWNQITKIEQLEKLSQLTGLNLSGNQITKIEQLDQLEKLTELDLSRNQITKIEQLDKLEKLTELDLSWNQITKIEQLEKLPMITKLYLGNNQITKIEQLDKLEKLTALYLDTNQITKIEQLDQLEKLTELGLSGNQITKIEQLDKLSQLTGLNLSGNQITKIEQLDQLEKLTELYLSGNQITKIENYEVFKKIIKALEIIDLCNNPFNEEKEWLNAEILNAIGNKPKELLKRLEDFLTNNIVKDFVLPYKIILLGNSEDGKTSLAKFLIRNNAKFKDKGSTHGLRIRKWKIDDESNALIYDFGGQDYYHAAYNMFFTWQTQFILLWDVLRQTTQHVTIDRKGVDLLNANCYKAYSPYYWLGNIKYWKEKQALLFPKNKDETKESNTKDDDFINLMTIQNLFNTNEVEYLHNNSKAIKIDHQHTVSLDTKQKSLLNDQRKELIKSILVTELKKFEITGLTKTDVDVVKSILEDDFSIQMTLNEFNQKFANRSNYLLKLLHNRGILLYYGNNIALKDTVWMNPELVSENIYRLLNKRELLNKGIIKKTNFKVDEKLFQLMKEQEIVFEDDEDVIIPQYLPETPLQDPLLILAKSGLKDGFSIQFEDFMPHGMMARLICRLGKNPGVKHFYRNEIIFSMDEKDNKLAKVNIMVDPIQLRMDVYVDVHEKNKNEILHYLFYVILLAYWNIKHESYSNVKIIKKGKNEELVNLEYNEKRNLLTLIYQLDNLTRFDFKLSLDREYYVDYNKELSQNNAAITLTAYKLDGTSKKTVFRSAFNPFTTEQKAVPRKLFISYSSKNTSYMRRFSLHLEALKAEGLVDYWTDRMITTGTSWDNKIQEELEKADIIIYLLSPNFLSTSYIMQKELPKGLEQEKLHNVKVFYIPLTYCHFDSYPEIREKQFLLNKSDDEKNKVVIQEPQNDKNWVMYINELREILKSMKD